MNLALKHNTTLKQKIIYLRLTITVIWKHALEAACSSNEQSQIQNVTCSLYRLCHQQCHWLCRFVTMYCSSCHVKSSVSGQQNVKTNSRP